MAHFYATIKGKSSERGAVGTKNSGLTAHVRGWNVGARIDCSYSDTFKKDTIKITSTMGSNNKNQLIPNLEVSIDDNGFIRVYANNQMVWNSYSIEFEQDQSNFINGIKRMKCENGLIKSQQ